MKHIFTALIILTTCGCQTTKHTCPVAPQTQKATVSVTPSDNQGNEFDRITDDTFLKFEFKLIKTNGSQEFSNIIIKQNIWASMERDIDIHGIEQKAKLQIDDEIIELNCSPGFHVKVKAIPLGENKVRLKGAYVYSDQKEKNLMKPKEIMSFNIITETGKTISLYELETKFEPEDGAYLKNAG